MNKSMFDVARGAYADEHRLFAQLMMSKGTIKVSEVGLQFKKVCNKLGNVKIKENLPQADCKKFAKTIADKMNTKLELIGLRLVFQYDECYDDLEYMILISEIDHPNSLNLKGSFTPEQIELLHHWLKKMFSLDNEMFGEISVEEALNDSKTPLTQNKNRNAVMNNAQLLIDELVKEKWFIVAGNGCLRLHARSITELELVLRSDLYDLKSCTLCKRLITTQRFAHHCIRCDNLSHKTCITRFLKRSKTINCNGKTLEGKICDAKFTHNTVKKKVEENQDEPTTSLTQIVEHSIAKPSLGNIEVFIENEVRRMKKFKKQIETSEIDSEVMDVDINANMNESGNDLIPTQHDKTLNPYSQDLFAEYDDDNMVVDN